MLQHPYFRIIFISFSPHINNITSSKATKTLKCNLFCWKTNSGVCEVMATNVCTINDITENLTSKVRLYADDTLIYRNILDEQDVVAFQNDLNSIVQWSIDWQMSFNPNKSEFLWITNKVSYILSDYYLKDCQILLVSHAKYLGVIIDKHLNCTDHVNMITTKANSVRGFLQHKCPSHVKSSPYITYVRPILDNACTVWSPYHQHNISKIEMVQRRAARFVTNNYYWNSSVTDMLQHLQWEQLQHWRDNFRAIIMYQIINNLVDINLSQSHLQLTNSITRGHLLQLMQLQTNFDCYKHSFLPHAIIIRNSLPPEIVSSATLDAFKGNLKQLP